MAEAFGSGNATNGRRLAPRRLPSVLEMALQSSSKGRSPTNIQTNSGSDLPNAAENPTWGAPRIHGELLRLGFEISEPTVSRWLQKMPRNSELGKRWLTFLRNHREAIAAMDFFTVPTLTFGILYCFFVIGHDRRKILRFNVTRHPSALWIVEQMRETWPYASAHRFLILDRDSKFSGDVVSSAKDLGSEVVRTCGPQKPRTAANCTSLGARLRCFSQPVDKILFNGEPDPACFRPILLRGVNSVRLWPRRQSCSAMVSCS
jgi:hypothetical protein